MIPALLAAKPFLAANWRALAVLGLVAVLGLALLYYRGNAAAERARAAELEGAYLLLADKVKQCNDANREWEASAAAAQERARVALDKARAAEKAREARAVSYDRAMRVQAPPSACPAGDAVASVREILRAERTAEVIP